MSESQTELAENLMARHEALKASRGPWDSFWQEIGEYVMPRKAQVTAKQSSPDASGAAQLFDGTAIQGNMVLANGQLSWMTPMESRWFSFDAPVALQGNDAAKQWFAACSEIASGYLARSRFYEQIHEHYLDRGGFGTAVLFCEEGKKTPLNFQNFAVGSFAIAEDDEGNVDTLFREFRLTARQAAQKFGSENLSDRLQAELGDEKRKDTEHEFLHCIYPREDIAEGRGGGKNKPIASVYLEVSTKHVLRESGYDEQPFFASRYLKWGDAAYGWSPSWMALPESRQLNFLEKQMDALAEKAAFPPMLVPSTHEGEIDVRAAGVTYYDGTSPGGAPREWMTAGRYDIGKDRADVKRKAIDRAFHVDLFQMFAQMEPRQMTAREVAERSSEKLIQFSPTFARMVTEIFNPLLHRVWALLARQGLFPAPPREVVVVDGSGAYVAEPEITYSSRIALAIKELENNAFDRQLEVMMPLLQLQPDIADNYDFDVILRDRGRNSGLPARWMRDAEEVAKMRAGRAQAQAAAAQMQQTQTAADAMHKVGSIPKDSALLNMVQGGGAA